MTSEMILVFNHLYDDVWAAFPKSNKQKNRFQLPTIIFPKDFVPTTGRGYKCRVTERLYATYIYNDQRYKVAQAMPKDMGDVVDFFHYQLDRIEKRKSRSRKDGGATMRAAFEKLLEGDKGFEKFITNRKAKQLSV